MGMCQKCEVLPVPPAGTQEKEGKLASADITKRAIADAMKTLMAEKPLAKISVGDVVERCGMNRNSFYYHFKDKMDLVNWIFYAEIAEVLSRDEVADGTVWVLLGGMCDYFYEKQVFYRNAFGVDGQNSFLEYFTDLMKRIIQARLSDIYNEGAYQDFFVDFYADVFVLTIRRWLLQGASMPPATLAGLLRKAMNGEGMQAMETDTPPEGPPEKEKLPPGG